MQLVEVRRVGFSAARDTIELATGRENVRSYALTSQATRLDTVKTSAPLHKYLSPNLQGFETRRLSGMGGSFIGLALSTCGAPDCYVSIYLDGTVLYYPKMADIKLPDGRPVQPPPDLYHIDVSDLAGVEFYPGGASEPVDLHSADDEGCGTVWLWTRER